MALDARKKLFTNATFLKAFLLHASRSTREGSKLRSSVGLPCSGSDATTVSEKLRKGSQSLARRHWRDLTYSSNTFRWEALDGADRSR